MLSYQHVCHATDVAQGRTPVSFTANPISADPNSTVSLRLNPDIGVTQSRANNNSSPSGGDIKAK